ncbi:MAG TPA: isoaspartyl peptidase/L-asparaginase, partial [Polyangiaceae bacterium]|nr:isoaspartyl peptidase/L-asparaginase [Polyangiaceae bacterium]
MSIVTRSGQAGAGVLVHGGAGAVDPARRADHVEGCREASVRGYAVIARGGSALDAAQEAARFLEDAPQFNAGTGAALNADGEVEHDAAIMCGATLRAGAVAALKSFRNPVDVARAVLEQSRHVLLAGEGA